MIRGRCSGKAPRSEGSGAVGRTGTGGPNDIRPVTQLSLRPAFHKADRPVDFGAYRRS